MAPILTIAAQSAGAAVVGCFAGLLVANYLLPRGTGATRRIIRVLSLAFLAAICGELWASAAGLIAPSLARPSAPPAITAWPPGTAPASRFSLRGASAARGARRRIASRRALRLPVPGRLGTSQAALAARAALIPAGFLCAQLISGAAIRALNVALRKDRAVSRKWHLPAADTPLRAALAACDRRARGAGWHHGPSGQSVRRLAVHQRAAWYSAADDQATAAARGQQERGRDRCQGASREG